MPRGCFLKLVFANLEIDVEGVVIEAASLLLDRSEAMTGCTTGSANMRCMPYAA